MLRVELHFALVAAAFSARILSWSSGIVHLISDDSWAECTLVIPPTAAFSYDDLRDFPREAKNFERLIIISPDGSLSTSRDYMVLGELKTPQ
jgi:hypothetical protein